jgi:sigma-B regulation protein RsbU (phosphoserine phosphatase)
MKSGETQPSQDEAYAYDRAPCALLTTLPNGTILRVNRTFCTWFGFSADELVHAKRMQDLLTTGCKIFHQTHWLPLVQMQGSVAEVQLEFVHRDGHAVPALVNAVQHMDPPGTTVEIAIFVAADRRRYERELLHARRRAEELLESARSAKEALALAEARLRLALDSARMIVWDVNAETGAMFFEAAAQRMLGLPADGRLDRDDYRRYIHPDDREAEEAAFAAALARAGTGFYAAEYRMLGTDGVERVISSTGRAFRDDAGELVRFSGVLQDVTTRRRAEELLKQQERDARSRAVLLEQLVGIVSHDLRTPLQAVSLGASLLASSPLSTSQTRTVNRISSAASRAHRLILDLLDFTQARLGGGIHVTKSECDVHAVVADVVEELKLAWPGRMLEHRALGTGMCLVDPDRISQIVTNLTTNALTYGQPDLVVTVRSGVAQSQCVIEVHNSGPPIPQELVPHVFEPLRRGEQQVKLGSRSVGLGLYIVQQIAAAHGGKVAVKSSHAEGTTFSVHLPARPSAG